MAIPKIGRLTVGRRVTGFAAICNPKRVADGDRNVRIKIVLSFARLFIGKDGNSDA